MLESSFDAPLSGLKVVELHSVGPIPFAGHMLRTLGANVIRVSPPTDRKLGIGLPIQYDLLNKDKEKRLLDLKTEAGLESLHQELVDADVMLEGFRPGVLERLKLAPTLLRQAYPKLVIGRLTGWGNRGELAERAGHDINYLARSGVLSAIGTDREPVVPLNLIGDFGGGAMHLLVGVLAKLVQRSIHQDGGLVETSILAGTIGLTPTFYSLLASGVWNLERANNLLDGALPFYRVYRCADSKFIAVGAIEEKFYKELLDVTGLTDQINPKDQYLASSWPATTQVFEQRFIERTRDEWAQITDSRDACISPVLDFLEAACDPHNLANELFHDEPFAQPGRMIRFG